MKKLAFLLDRETAPLFRLTGLPVVAVKDPGQIPASISRLREEGTELVIISENLVRQVPENLWEPGTRTGPWLLVIPGIGDPGGMLHRHLARLRARAVGSGEQDQTSSTE